MSNFPVQYWNLGIGPITCHAWSKDRTQLAVSPSSKDIYIFVWEAGQWKLAHSLSEHDLPVTGIDWAPNSNRIVSCSQDMSACVWTWMNGNWKPELVLARINRAATCVKWSPLENKFAVGSGEKLVSVCFYAKENDWWVADRIRKPLRSTVTCVDWHPNNILLAVGACDFKIRVFSAYLKEVDEKPTPNPWGTKMPFGALLCEVKTLGWVHHVGFSPSGFRLAYVTHGSVICIIDTNRSLEESSCLRTSHLPFTSVQWITENGLVAGGHDNAPMLFMYTDDKIKFVKLLDVPSEQKSSNISAMQKFRNIDRNAALENLNVQLKTLHQNTIKQILPHSGRAQNVLKFTTCSTDGLIALWDLKNAPMTAK